MQPFTFLLTDQQAGFLRKEASAARRTGLSAGIRNWNPRR
jgi:hypothetical protein